MEATSTAGRWFRFLLAIAAGATMGVFYAWRINPPEMVDAPLSALRIDYLTDWTLMTAETYSQEKDLDAAVRRLAELGAAAPQDIAREAVDFAETQTARGDYTNDDLEQLRLLYRDLLTRTGQVTP